MEWVSLHPCAVGLLLDYYPSLPDTAHSGAKCVSPPPCAVTSLKEYSLRGEASLTASRCSGIPEGVLSQPSWWGSLRGAVRFPASLCSELPAGILSPSCPRLRRSGCCRSPDSDQTFVQAAPAPDVTLCDLLSKEVFGVLGTHSRVSADESNWGSNPPELVESPVPTC